MNRSAMRAWIVAGIGLCVPAAAVRAEGIPTDNPNSPGMLPLASPWGGALRGSTTWRPEFNPYTVAGELKVPKGATLTILPGTTVLFQADARILVNGRLLAEGTATSPILFTQVADKIRWRGLQFDQTMEDSRIRHARLEWARTDDGMVGLQKSRLLLEDVAFDHCDRRRIRTLSSSLIVRRCQFADMFGPTEPPTTDNMSENIWGSGIPDGGWLIIDDNVFGRNKGHNDAIDFDGPAAPKPIPHIRNNLFLGGGDDAMDLECDALIEGNTFTNFVKDQYNKASGESNVLSAGAGKHYTMIHNVILNSQHIVQVKNEAFLTFTNNTAVNISGAAIYFELGLPGRRPGRGGDIANSIFWNTPDVFEGISGKTDFAVDYSLLPMKWHSFGTGNIYADPLFARPGYWDPKGTPNDPKDDVWVDGDYHLKSKVGRWDPVVRQWVSDKVTSPCIDAGNNSPDWRNECWPHGRRIDMGAYGGTPQASMSPSASGSPADFSGDGRIDLRDYSILARGWLSLEAPRREDLNRDTTVDFTDLTTFSSWWLWPTRR